MVIAITKQSKSYSYTSTCPISPIVKGPDFFAFLLKAALSCVQFRDPSLPGLATYKKHGPCPCPYPRRHARLKVYPHFLTSRTDPSTKHP